MNNDLAMSFISKIVFSFNYLLKINGIIFFVSFNLCLLKLSTEKTLALASLRW